LKKYDKTFPKTNRRACGVRRGLVCIIAIGLCLSKAAALPGIPALNLCPDIIFNHGWQNDSQPSGGAGGPAPGPYLRTAVIPQTGTYINYYVYIPSNYQPGLDWPLLIALHGAAGDPDTAKNYAQDMRDFWSASAEQYGFLVAAPVATGSNGSWLPANLSVNLKQILLDMRADYNIETRRILGYGFSAGGHIMHAIALDHSAIDRMQADKPNSAYFAAYGVTAGVLGGFTCPHPPAGHPDCDSVPLNASRTIPVYQAHGTADSIVPVAYAQADRVGFLNAGWAENRNYWLTLFAGGHTVPASYPAAFWQKLCTATSPP